MKAPRKKSCTEGGDCSFVLRKRGYWQCRKCGEVHEFKTTLTDDLLSEMSKHSSGNWFVDPIGPRSSVSSSSGKHVAMINYFQDVKGRVSVTGKEHAANALLIASAPLLLEEVKRLRKQLSGRKAVRRVR